jgi:hypothetical protein
MTEQIGKEPDIETEIEPVRILKRSKEEAEIEEEEPINRNNEEDLPNPLSIDVMISAGMVGPIGIDGIPFYLMGIITGVNESGEVERTQDGTFFDRYKKVAILSGNPNDEENRTLFWVYPSQSELGMWRLCYTYAGREDKRLQYDKLTSIFTNPPGTGDYVQTTLIHMELQLFINQHISELVVYNGPSGVFNDVMSKTRIPYNLKYFESAADGPTITCPVFDSTTYEGVNPFGREIKIEEAPFSYMNKKKCGSKFSTDLVKQEKQMREIKKNLQLFSESFDDNYEIKVDGTGRYENVLIYQNYSSSIIDRDFSIKTVMGDIYSVTLKAKSDEDYTEEVREIKIIYFRTTRFIGFDKYYPTNANYYMTITIIPSTSVCNKYGLYSRYIFAGMYVCKLVDYKVQCTTNEAKYKSCTETYAFVGDRYDGLFPYTKIQEYLVPRVEEATQPYDGGGSRRTKRSKRKSKRQITRKLKKKRKTHKRGIRGRSHRR